MDMEPQKLAKLVVILEKIMTGKYVVKTGAFTFSIITQGKINLQFKKTGPETTTIFFVDQKPRIEMDGPAFFDIDGAINKIDITKKEIIIDISGLPDLKIPIVE